MLVGIAGCADGSTSETVIDTPSELLNRIGAPVEGGGIHFVRLVQRGDFYAFDPATLVIGESKVIRFVLTADQPESVAFDPESATAEAAEFIRANGLDLGVLLVDAGQVYDVSFSGAPPGRYPFYSIPHRGHGMAGMIIVPAADEER